MFFITKNTFLNWSSTYILFRNTDNFPSLDRTFVFIFLLLWQSSWEKALSQAKEVGHSDCMDDYDYIYCKYNT